VDRVGNLTRYLQDIRKYPILDEATERTLADRWRERRDRDAAAQLVGSHLRLVVKIAKGFSGYGLPVADLISEGNVGVMKALERFDPDRGFRFATYAVWWIRAEIQEYVVRGASMVRLGTTAAQKKLFFNLRRLKAQHQELDDGDLAPETVAAVARKLGVQETEVVEMNRRLGGGVNSLDATVRDGSETEFLDLLVDESQDQESALGEAEQLHQRRGLMKAALKTLDDRERHILVQRRLKEDPPTLADLSRVYNILRERVRQIESRAFEKVQKAVRSAVRAEARARALAA
jgi:RNA polymerase sigma-32 factor